MEDQKITGTQVWLGILLVALIVAGYHISDSLGNHARSLAKQDQQTAQTDEIKRTVDDIKKAVSPYTAKDALAKKVVLTGFENSAKNGEQTGDIEVKTKVTGTIKFGYLYARASANGRALGKDGDVFVMLKSGLNKDLGGHLITSRSLETPTSNDFTEILFPLDDVKYKVNYNDPENPFLTGDYLAFLNQYKNSTVLTFSSTELEGRLEELSIYYECADGSDCSIEVVK